MQIKTIMRYPSTAVRIVKFKTLTASNADEDVKQQELINCYRNAKWYTHFESLVGSYKTKYTLTVWSSNHAPWYLPKGVKNLCPHKNLHTKVYSSFIHNCQKLEAPKMTISRWMDKLWCIHTMEYFSELKRNELSSHEKTCRKLKCIWLSQRGQSEKTIYCMIPTIHHSAKGKIMEIVNSLVVTRD